jgi:hypothetical protein
MTKRKIDFSIVRDIALTFPGVEESTSYGAPALKVNGQRIAAIPVNRSAEPGSLGLSIAIEDRDELIAAAPDVYVTNHYVGYPCVLVRMSQINEEVLRDLLGMAYKFVTRKRKVNKWQFPNAPSGKDFPASPEGTKHNVSPWVYERCTGVLLLKNLDPSGIIWEGLLGAQAGGFSRSRFTSTTASSSMPSRASQPFAHLWIFFPKTLMKLS